MDQSISMVESFIGRCFVFDLNDKTNRISVHTFNTPYSHRVNNYLILAVNLRDLTQHLRSVWTNIIPQKDLSLIRDLNSLTLGL